MPLTDLISTVSPQRQVAIRTGLPNYPFTPSGNTNYAECQAWMSTVICYATNNLRIGWANYRYAPGFDGITGKKEIIGGVTNMTVRAAVSISGVDYPLYTTDGQRDLVIAPDAIGIFAPLNLAISAQTSALIKYLLKYDAIPPQWNMMVNNQASLVGRNEFGTGLTDRTTSANWTAPNHIDYLPMPPQFILGDTTNTKSFEIWGDSIGAGGTGDMGYVSDLGFLQRAARASYIPYITNGAGGKALWQYTSTDPDFVESRNRRRALAPSTATGFCFIQMCTNDFAWGGTSSSVIANMQLMAQQALARGQKPIIFTCPPRTNNTNNGKYGPDAAAVPTYINEYNAHVRTNNGYGYGYVDLGLLWADTVDNTKWNASYFGDGIHPGQPGYVAADTLMQSKFPVLTQIWRN